MEIIRYTESGRQPHWRAEIACCDWRAGQYLHQLLRENTFFDTIGADSDVLLLTDGDTLISFCTLAQCDEIQPTSLKPWIGFVYTFPEHRGHRYAGLLFDRAAQLAAEQGFSAVYVSTDHIGLYETYGFTYLTQMRTIYGESARVYVRKTRIGRKES